MNETAREDLILAVHAAAVGRRSWEEALEVLRVATRGWLAQIMAIDKHTGGPLFSHIAGGTSLAHLDYIRTYHRSDPCLPLMLAHPGTDWLHCHQRLSEAHVAADPFFQEFLIPHGARYVTGAKLVDDDEMAVILAVVRAVDDVPVEDDTLAWMESVRPHFMAALDTYRHLTRHKTEHRMGMLILDTLPHSVLLLDTSCGLRYANEAGRQLLARTTHLVNRHGMLGCLHPVDDAALTDAVQRVALPPGSPQGTHRRLVRIQGVMNDEPVIVCCSALPPAQVMGMFGSVPLVMVMVHDPSHEADPFVLAELYGLTPAEAQVVAALAQGRSVQAIAEQRRVSIHTVRSQVKLALDKSGAQSLADLTRRAAMLCLLKTQGT